MAKTYEQMKKDLLERTKKNYDRREPESGAKYFDRDAVANVKFWKATPTKGNPHIIDIIPFEAGGNFPANSGVEEGSLVYSLDLWVHPNVGPGKVSVICPAKNYGEPCPICDEVDELIKEGVEWNEIPITPKRRVIYNVVVMDDAKTEAQGVQIWDVSYKYMEDPILALSKSPRAGGVVAFAAPDKASGRSIAFDVGSDTYRKITGHRFEPRDYDISEEILEQAVQLDQIITVLPEDEIKKILFGSSGSHKEESEEEEKKETKSRRRNVKQEEEEEDVPDPEEITEEEEEEKKETKRTLTKRSKSKATCQYGEEHFGVDYDEYQECEECENKQECCEAKDAIELEKEKKEKEQKKEDPPKRRTLLRRR